jgi:hypothetical protein
MVIYDFDVLCASVRPAEAYAELVIDPDAVLTGAITLQGFQPIAGRHAKVIQSTGNLQLTQLPTRDGSDAGKSPNPLALCNRLCVSALERLDHNSIIMYRVNNVKRLYDDSPSTIWFQRMECGRETAKAYNT